MFLIKVLFPPVVLYVIISSDVEKITYIEYFFKNGWGISNRF